MTLRGALLGSIALSLCAASSAAFAEQEEQGREGRVAEGAEELDATMKDLPAAAKEALRQQAGGGEISNVAKGDLDGRSVFSAHITKPDGSSFRVVIDENGKLLEKTTLGKEKGGQEKGTEGEGQQKEQPKQER